MDEMPHTTICGTSKTDSGVSHEYYYAARRELHDTFIIGFQLLVMKNPRRLLQLVMFLLMQQ